MDLIRKCGVVEGGDQRVPILLQRLIVGWRMEEAHGRRRVWLPIDQQLFPLRPTRRPGRRGVGWIVVIPVRVIRHADRRLNELTSAIWIVRRRARDLEIDWIG